MVDHTTSGLGTESPLDSFGATTTPSRVPRVLMWTGLGFVILAGAYVAGQWSVADKIPAGTSVVGIAIGGMSSEEAVTALDRGVERLSVAPIAVLAGSKDATVDPVGAGLTVDSTATIQGLSGFSLAPAHLWNSFFGGGAVAPVVRVDDTAMAAQLDILAASVVIAPVDGTVVFTEGEAHATPAKDGQDLDKGAARTQITGGWLVTDGPIPVTVTPHTPVIDQAKTDTALTEAKHLVSAPISISVDGQVVELPTKTIGAASSYVVDGGVLTLKLDSDVLRDGVLSRTIDLETKAANAKFVFKDGKPVISGGKTGMTLDGNVIADQVAAVGTSGSDRTAVVELVKTEAKRSRAALEALGVKKVVSEFTTPLGASDAARIHNLQLGSKKVTGSLIMPGETWSLTESLEPITAEGGYRGAGIVNNGVLTTGVGGGLSQMATTTYNVGFFAGLEDVEHRPHSYWFNRYPEGREATIFVGSIDMRFKNDTPYGILMQAYVSNGSLTVRAWSTPHYRVETSTSARRNVQSPITTRNTAPDCIAQSTGSPGFAVTVYRKVFLGDELIRDEAQSWGYRPQNAIVCGPEPKEESGDKKKNDKQASSDKKKKKD